MAGNSFLAQQAEKWMAAPTPGEEQRIRNRLAAVRARSNYHNVLLLDRQANLRLALAEEADPVTPEDRQLARQAMGQGKPLLSDLYVIPETETSRVDFVAPLMVRHGDRDVTVGVLLLRVDPRTFLYPLIRSLPGSSGSAETLLVHREGNNALFLDNVPGRPATALTLGPPPELPAATATGGREGIAEGVDYRGARVLAAIHPVPGVPWYVVAKIDQSEVYAPISALALAGGSLLGVFTITAGLVLVLWWRDQSIRQAFGRFRDEQERQALLQHLDYLSKYANDIIILVDEDGRIVEANDRAAEAYGYSREELIGLEERQLRAPETQAAFETDWRELEEQSARVYETIHVRQDGTTFPVEISARVIEVDRKRFRQSIIRDITERKTAQSKLEQHLDELLRFQRLTVGRELRMKELAEENQRLREQLAEENQRLREQLGEAAKPGPPR
jgi:PAS domain S-box-containing protein